MTNGEQLFMGNSSISKFERQGKTVLKMILGKEVTLNNVMHVLEIQKNLVFRSLLRKNDFKLIFVYEKLVLIKDGCMWKNII